MFNQCIADYCLLMRVMAVHVVVIGHAASYFGVLHFTQWPQSPYFQSIAVIAFFFLSGFTIAWLCDSRGLSPQGYSYQRFLFDRACRIYIPLIPVLCLYGILEYFFYKNIPHSYPKSYTIGTFFVNIFFITTAPFHAAPFGTNRPLWSTAQEWWLYLSYGMLALKIGTTKPYIKRLLILLFLFSLLFTLSDILGGAAKELGLVWIIGVLTWKLIKNNSGRYFSTSVLFVLLIFTISVLFLPKTWPKDGTYSTVWNLLVACPLLLGLLIASQVKSRLIPESMRKHH